MVKDWHHLVGTFNGVALLTIATAPVAVLVVFLLVWRRAGARRWRTSVAEVGIVYGTVPWVWMTMLPGSHAGTDLRRVSLIPLRDLLTMSALQIVGNLLLFAALGVFAPLRFPVLASLPRVLLLAAACSMLVEIAQYVLRLDRVSSVDDVLLNTAGAGLAALASRRWWRDPATFRRHIENRIQAGNTTSP